MPQLPKQLAPLALLLCSCPSPSDSFEGTASGGTLPNEDWVFQLESLPSSSGGESWYEELFVGTAQTSKKVSLFLDLNYNHAFEEGAKLVGKKKGDLVSIDATYFHGGQTVEIEATLEYFGNNHVAGDWVRTIDKVATSFHVVGVRVGNPPQLDLSGDWSVSFTVNSTSPELDWPLGSTEEHEWAISQVTSGIHNGLLRIVDADQQSFLGMVNDSQVTLARRYLGEQGLTTYTFPSINPGIDSFTGQLFGLVEDSEVHDVSWNLEGSRAVAESSNTSLSLVLFDDRVDQPAGPSHLNLQGPNGRMLVAVGGPQAAPVVVPLTPGTWQISHAGDSNEVTTVHAKAGDGPRVIPISTLSRP